MLLNDLKFDCRIMMAKHDLKIVDVARIVGCKYQQIQYIMRSKVILPSFVNMYEKLGYDIRIEYVKREDCSLKSVTENFPI